jgi:RND superfamily putative drug exporter
MPTKSKKPLALAILVVILWFLFAGASGSLFSQLSSVQENNNSSFLPKDSEGAKASLEIAKFSGSDSFNLPTLILFEGKSSPDAIAALNLHYQTIGNIRLGDTSAKLGDYLVPGENVTAIPSQDGLSILVNIPFQGELLGKQLSNKKPVLPEIIEALRIDARKIAADYKLKPYVTGPGGIFGDLFGAFSSLDLKLELITLGAVALILILVYRSPVLWIIPLLCALFALFIAGGLIYVLAKKNVLDVDGQSQGILSVLVIGAATDYALLLIARYREELHRFESRFEAMKAAYKGVWEPILASGSTVSIALLMLLFSQLSNTRGLGPIGAIGIVSAVITVLTLLPALLLVPSAVLWFFTGLMSIVSLIIAFSTSISPLIRFPISLVLLACVAAVIYFAVSRVKQPTSSRFNKEKFAEGRWVFWPRIPWNDGDDHVLTGVWSRVGNSIEKAPRKAWILTSVLLVALAFASTSLKADGLGTVDSFTGNPESVVGQNLLLEHFPGGEGDPTQVVVSASKADALIEALSSVKGVTDVSYLVDPITQNVKIVDGKVIVNATLDKAPDSVEAGEYVAPIRQAAHEVDPTSLVGGTSATYFDLRNANSRDNRTIIPIILIVITLILGLLLRSILSAIVLLGTVVLSYFATLGVCALVFNHIFGFAGGDNSFPLFAFIFLVALGIDYNIFLMTRVREEASKIGTRAGMTKGVTVTGAVITSAGVVLAATFAVLGTLPLVPLAELGFAVAFGVLLDTIIVRSILVPALVHEIGPKIWWPSKLQEK